MKGGTACWWCFWRTVANAFSVFFITSLLSPSPSSSFWKPTFWSKTLRHPFFFGASAQSIDEELNACNTTDECLENVGNGSECILPEGQCSNPFAKGCFHRLKSGWKRKRICNSDDGPLEDAVARGLCDKSIFDYMEIRLHTESWESVVFEDWILQIVLSEYLDVPTTLESGVRDLNLNFYHPYNPSDNSNAVYNEYESLYNANELEDCRLAATNSQNSTYMSCAHMIAEVWELPYNWQEELQEGRIENPQGLGMIGRDSWFTTKFTAEKDPSLVNYLGLHGEKNRRKLAETYLRPTTWVDYCNQVSPDNCTQIIGANFEDDDVVALRAPEAQEADRFFVEDFYKGHFRKTSQNDCDLNPATCTGYIANFPCYYKTHLEQQLYHLDIALSMDTDEWPTCSCYYQSQLMEMWKAANATKSNMLLAWYTPERFYQSFLGSDAEFMVVTLPPVTSKCEAARAADRCSNDTFDVVGSAVGACAERDNPLMKMYTGSLYGVTYDPAIQSAVRSPAYDALHYFTLSSLQLGDIFDNVDKYSSKREAVCRWVVDNEDVIKYFIPRDYPRYLNQIGNAGPLAAISALLGGIATMVVLWCAYVVHKHRKARIIRVAQIEFLFLILLGSLCVAVGAIVIGAQPTDASCVIRKWLINFGYTLMLVPLIVKIAAINRLMNAAKKMRRVTLQRKQLFGAVFIICSMVAVFLVCWTMIGKPRVTAEYVYTGNDNVDGLFEVQVLSYCKDESPFWGAVALGWNAILLLNATILAIQSRKIRQDFNESQILGIMIYSQGGFLVIRIITYALASVINGLVLSRTRSVLYSFDSTLSTLIYFLPKFANVKDELPKNLAKLLGGFAAHVSTSSYDEGTRPPSSGPLGSSVRNLHDVSKDDSQIDNNTSNTNLNFDGQNGTAEVNGSEAFNHGGNFEISRRDNIYLCDQSGDIKMNGINASETDTEIEEFPGPERMYI